MNVEIRDTRFRDVVGDDAVVTEVASGFRLTEGAVWHHVEKHLIFSSEDNLYVTGPGGIHVFAADAKCLGVIYVPQQVTNFTWGDDDRTPLFITAWKSLYRTRVNVPGRVMF